jgi:hypothetical protein
MPDFAFGLVLVFVRAIAERPRFDFFVAMNAPVARIVRAEGRKFLPSAQ